jgi:hypothetical protein
MPVNDTYMTKTITTSGTGAQYPTGAIVSGGSAVDEIDLSKVSARGNLVLWIAANLDSGSGNLAVVFQSDDNTSFNSAQDRVTMPTLTGGTDTYREAPLPFIPERYGRIKLTPTSSAVFTCSCGVGLGSSSASGRVT